MARLLGVAAAIELLYLSLPRDAFDHIQTPDVAWWVVAPVFCVLVGLGVTLAVHALLKLIRVTWID